MMNVKSSEVVGAYFPEWGHFYMPPLFFDRWSGFGKQNTWEVRLIMGPEQREFVNIGGFLDHIAYGVMDDFGNLVKVEA